MPIVRDQSQSNLGGKRENQSLIRVENESGVVFTYSREERQAIVEHINARLAGDADLGDRLPLNPHSDEIFDAVDDGLLTCKFVSVVSPDPIPKSLYTVKVSSTGQGRFQKTENHVAALRFAQELGIKVVSIGPTDFMERKVSLILGLLWQLVRVDLMNGVLTIADKLKMDGALGPEAILLRWVNGHLEQAQHERRISNFASDINDSVVYSVLLHQLDSKCSLSVLQEKDLHKRATLMLEQAEKVRCRKFINAHDVVKGDSRLNTAFVANLFSVFNKVEEEEPESDPESEPELQLDEDIDSDDEEAVARLQEQVAKLQKQYEQEEREAQMKEEITRAARDALEKRADELRSILEKTRASQRGDLAEQDDKIRALRDRLREMEKEADKAGDTDNLRLELLKFENEKAEIVAAQRKMEEQFADLQEDLDDKVSERELAQERKERAEEELRKTRVLHKTRIARLRNRLIKQQQDNEQLEDELDDKIQVREAEQDNLWQLERKDKQLGAEMSHVQSSRDRIARAKHMIEMQMKQAERDLQAEASAQREETHTKVKLSAKVTKLTTLEYDLRSKKADAMIRLRSTEAEIDEMKFELEDATDDKIREKQVHTNLRDDVFELEGDLEYADESKLDDVKRLAREQQRAVERAKAAMAKHKRKAAAPVAKLNDQAQQAADIIEAERAQQAALQLEKERTEAEGQALAKELLDVTASKQLAKEEAKAARRAKKKTTAQISQEQAEAHEAKRLAHQEAMRAKKAQRGAAGTALEAEALARDARDLETEAERIRVEAMDAETKADEAAREARKHQTQAKALARERKEQEGRAAKEAAEIAAKADREAARLSHQAATSEKRARNAEQAFKLGLVEAEDAKDEAERAARKAAAKDDAEVRAQRDVELQLERKREQREEAERAKRQFEKQLADVAKYVTPSSGSSRRSSFGRKSSSLEKDAQDKQAAAKNAAKTKAQLAEEARVLGLEVETSKAELAARSTVAPKHAQFSADFEAQLAEFSADFNRDVSSKKDSVKKKHRAERDLARKARRKEKAKLAHEAKNLDTQMEELQQQLEEEKRLKDLAEGKH